MSFSTSADAPLAYPNEPLMYPTRLHITSSLYTTLTQLYAYSNQRPAETLVQLQTSIPALIDFVLGPMWRDELSERGTLKVPQTNWTNENETDIAFRMFRCVAAIVDHSIAMGAWWALGDPFGWHWQSAQRQQKYIFGWPSAGGVWVLHLPPLLEKHNDENLDLGEELTQHHRQMHGDDTVSRNVDGTIHYGDLVKSTTMEEFCERLKDKGARFYGSIESSVEVVETGLLNAEAALKKDPIPDI